MQAPPANNRGELLRWLLLCLWTATAVAMGSVPALAEPNVRTGARQDATGNRGAADHQADDGAADRRKREYMELVRKALSEYDLGHFREAKAYFEQAHALRPSARTLRGLALTTYELRHYVEAMTYMKYALASDVRPLNDKMRKHLETLSREARLFVARVTVTYSPRDAVMRVDGRIAKPDAHGLLLLDAGRHEFVVSAEGHDALTRSVEVEGNETLSLAFTLKPDGPEKVVVVAPPPAAAPEQPEQIIPAPLPPEEPVGGSIAPWILIGSGAAAAIAGGVLTAMSFADIDRIEGAEMGSRWAEVSDAYDRSPVLSGVGIALLATGLAGATVGAVWKLQTPEDRPEPQAWLRVTPVGATAGGRF